MKNICWFVKACIWMVLFVIGFIIYTVILPFSPKKATRFEEFVTERIDKI